MKHPTARCPLPVFVSAAPDSTTHQPTAIHHRSWAGPATSIRPLKHLARDIAGSIPLPEHDQEKGMPRGTGSTSTRNGLAEAFTTAQDPGPVTKVGRVDAWHEPATAGTTGHAVENLTRPATPAALGPRPLSGAIGPVINGTTSVAVAMNPAAARDHDAAMTATEKPCPGNK